MIEELHKIYCDETHFQLSCSLQRHFAWEAFIARGFTALDLRLVCRQMRKEMLAGKRWPQSLSFHAIICDLENFEEKLAQYRALERKPKFSAGKAKVLRVTGRVDEPKQPDAKPVADVMKGLKMAQQLRDFKNKL